MVKGHQNSTMYCNLLYNFPSNGESENHQSKLLFLFHNSCDIFFAQACVKPPRLPSSLRTRPVGSPRESDGFLGHQEGSGWWGVAKWHWYPNRGETELPGSCMNAFAVAQGDVTEGRPTFKHTRTHVLIQKHTLTHKLVLYTCLKNYFCKLNIYMIKLIVDKSETIHTQHPYWIVFKVIIISLCHK